MQTDTTIQPATTPKLTVEIPIVVDKLFEMVREHDTTEEQLAEGIIFVAEVAAVGGDALTFLRSLHLAVEADTAQKPVHRAMASWACARAIEVVTAACR